MRTVVVVGLTMRIIDSDDHELAVRLLCVYYVLDY